MTCATSRKTVQPLLSRVRNCPTELSQVRMVSISRVSIYNYISRWYSIYYIYPWKNRNNLVNIPRKRTTPVGHSTEFMWQGNPQFMARFKSPVGQKKGETGFKLVLSHGKMILEISRTYLTYYEKKRRVTITCADLCWLFRGPIWKPRAKAWLVVYDAKYSMKCMFALYTWYVGIQYTHI